MTTLLRTITLCDLCGSEEASAYTVGRGTKGKPIDLCREHAVDIERLIDAAPAPRRGRPPRPLPASAPITTIDEIEARKKS